MKKRIFALLIVLICSVLFITGCGNNTGDLWLTGTAYNAATREQLGNIKIFVKSGPTKATAYTDMKGNYKLDKLKPGIYEFDVEIPASYATNYEFTPIPINVQNSIVGLDFYVGLYGL